MSRPKIKELREKEAYGVFCCTAYPSLITDDKQLHIGPSLVKGTMQEHWVSLGNTIAWLEEQLPDHTFTLVIDKWGAFDNPYLWEGLGLHQIDYKEEAP